MAFQESSLPLRNGSENTEKPLNRTDEVDDLIKAVQSLIIPFIRAADEDAPVKHTGHGRAIPGGGPRTALVEYHPPEKLARLLDFELPNEGRGKDGLLQTVEKLLQYSVNTWDQGFLDKLYASTNAVGVVSELLLAVLNTNVHVFAVSPALTLIEKTTTRSLAGLFGFHGPHAGGISTQGGSASNTTALILARNTLYPTTKTAGNAPHIFTLFTSAHGHYSLEKAAQQCGFGSDHVCSVPVDADGRMDPRALEDLIMESKSAGKTPLLVNATAGTTVLGSYDPFESIAQICKRHHLWLHIDASWGGPVIFSEKRRDRLAGVEKADSLVVSPHKMMGVPLTCSFLLGPDMRIFHRANTLPAAYLFHSVDDDEDGHDERDEHEAKATPNDTTTPDREIYDLADLTLQCGRRGDSLKLALSWIFHGTSGFRDQIDHAFDMASELTSLIVAQRNFILVSANPPPCLQVCFYWAREGRLSESKQENTRMTSRIVKGLVRRGWMVDYAPGERGSFFRVVVNRDTRWGTVTGLVLAVEEVGGGL